MDSTTVASWYAMPVTMQISNIGSEVSRAIRWKNKGDDVKKVNFCKKAIEFLNLSISDPKNVHRKQEFEFCIEELQDYFMGNNDYDTTDEMLEKYYDAFLNCC